MILIRKIVGDMVLVKSFLYKIVPMRVMRL